MKKGLIFLEDTAVKRHFLGANSRYGFYSLYGELSRADNDLFLYLIKGGPGCGKSSFMRRIAQAAQQRGLRVEYILCSADPDSLDGLIIPEKGLAWVDATAPHMQDAELPGAAAMYIDLGRFYDPAGLRHLRSEMAAMKSESAALYALAYDRIAAAASVMPRCFPGLWGEEEQKKAERKALAVTRGWKREDRPAGGRAEYRFRCALGAGGTVALPCPAARIWQVDAGFGPAQPFFNALLSRAQELGEDVTVYRDHIDPGLLSGLYIPARDVAFIAPEPGEKTEIGAERQIHPDKLVPRSVLTRCRAELRRAKKLSAELLEFSVLPLVRAREIHDELEKLYNPHVDFEGVYAEARRFINDML